MRILITGNQGYLGPNVVRQLRRDIPGVYLIGHDAGFYSHLTTSAKTSPGSCLDEQHKGDIREFPTSLLNRVDGIVHLAAISNDPMGACFAEPTDEVNRRGASRLAKMAAAAGVSHFVFASSCSVYGLAPGGPRRETDGLNPRTAYAKSKVECERALAAMQAADMTITCLRFATACGMSDRLRLDLVLNDFVASAVTSGIINVLSDGFPWRPLIDVRDMARAISWAITRDPTSGGNFLAVNAGSDHGNYQIRDLARAVADAIPNTSVTINTGAQADERSYKVDFSLFKAVAPAHQPENSLAESIRSLREGLEEMGFADPDFRNSRYVRLKTLEAHVAAGRLSPALRWTPAFVARN